MWGRWTQVRNSMLSVSWYVSSLNINCTSPRDDHLMGGTGAISLQLDVAIMASNMPNEAGHSNAISHTRPRHMAIRSSRKVVA